MTRARRRPTRATVRRRRSLLVLGVLAALAIAGVAFAPQLKQGIQELTLPLALLLLSRP